MQSLKVPILEIYLAPSVAQNNTKFKAITQDINMRANTHKKSHIKKKKKYTDSFTKGQRTQRYIGKVKFSILIKIRTLYEVCE